MSITIRGYFFLFFNLKTDIATIPLPMSNILAGSGFVIVAISFPPTGPAKSPIEPENDAKLPTFPKRNDDKLPGPQP